MADEQPQEEPQVEPLRFVQTQVLITESWPQRTALTPEWMRYAHVHKATVAGDTITIRASNGTAIYKLRRDLPMHGDGIVADLQEGDAPGRLRQMAKKYTAAEDAP